MHRFDHDTVTDASTGGTSETERLIARGHDLGWEQLVEEFGQRGTDPRFVELDDTELERQVCVQAADITAAMCRWLELLGELVRRRVWADQGAKTPGVWLSWRLGIDGATAREHVRVALRLRDLPKVRDRFAEGTLSYSKVRAISRVAVAASEELLLSWADHATAAQLETIVRGLRTAQRAQRQELPDGEDRRFRQHVRVQADGTAVMTVTGPLEDITALDEGIHLLARSLVEDRVGEGGRDPGATAVRRVTAAERVEALGHAVAAAVASQVPADTSGLDRNTLVLHLDARDLATPPTAGPDLVAVRDAHARPRAVDRRALHRLACDAGIVPAVTRGQPTTLDLGRRRRRTTAALRRAVALRDRGCTFPGCHATRHLHAHHVTEWSRGGTTDLANLVQLCSYHHRFIHDHGWHIQVAPDGHHRFAPTASAEALPHIGHLAPHTVYGPPEEATGDPPDRTVTASAEALAPPGDIDLRPFDLDTAVAVLLGTYLHLDHATAA